MTPVKLTAFERSDIKNSAIVRAAYIDKIIATFDFFTAGPSDAAPAFANIGAAVAWARSRNMATKIKKNPGMLLSDGDLMNVFELSLIDRQFDNKDNDTPGTLEEKFIAYMDDGNKWGALNDDYYSFKNGGLEI